MFLAALVALQLAAMPQTPMCPQAGRPDGVATEWTILTGAARAIALFDSTGGRSYGVQTVSWSRTLTEPHGPGLLRGCFAWGIEVMPALVQFSPSHLYGAGVAPVMWRWHFLPLRNWSAFAELSMGGLWTTDPIPEKTQAVNFTAHWGGGVRWHTSPRDSIVFAYRLQHFSNGNQLRSNPGVNSHVLLVGWSHR